MNTVNTLLTVKRMPTVRETTLGQLFVRDKLDGYTCEDAVRKSKIKGETAIPDGVYDLGTRFSPRFSNEYLWSDSLKKLIPTKDLKKYPNTSDFKPHELIWVKNVPNFEFILIHWGNTKLDTEGCLLVGNKTEIKQALPAVINSRIYYVNLYERIYPLIKQGNQKITYLAA